MIACQGGQQYVHEACSTICGKCIILKTGVPLRNLGAQRLKAETEG